MVARSGEFRLQTKGMFGQNPDVSTKSVLSAAERARHDSGRRGNRHGSDFIVFVFKDLFYRYTEGSSKLERQRQRRRVLAGFDGDDGLTSNADTVGQLLLRQLAVVKTQPADLVAKPVTTHRYPPVRT